MTCLRCGTAFIPGRPSLWCLRCRLDHEAGWRPPQPAYGAHCCDPTHPPTAAAYRRHRANGSVPCAVAVADSAAYRHRHANRKASA